MDRVESSSSPHSDTSARPRWLWAVFYMMVGGFLTLVVLREAEPSIVAELEDCQRLVQHQAELIGRYAEKADRCNQDLP